MQHIDGTLSGEVEKRTTRQVVRDMAKSTAARSMYVFFSPPSPPNCRDEEIQIWHRNEKGIVHLKPNFLATYSGQEASTSLIIFLSSKFSGHTQKALAPWELCLQVQSAS